MSFELKNLVERIGAECICIKCSASYQKPTAGVIKIIFEFTTMRVWFIKLLAAYIRPYSNVEYDRYVTNSLYVWVSFETYALIYAILYFSFFAL